MATPKPALGDPVLHHGRPHIITGFPKEGRAQYVVFENDGFQVQGMARDLEWLEPDGAWYMPGRLLSRDERCMIEAALGTYPPAVTHLTVRDALDAIDLTNVDLSRLRDSIARRKPPPYDPTIPPEARAWTPALLEAEAPGCVAHCQELRALRQTEGYIEDFRAEYPKRLEAEAAARAERQKKADARRAALRAEAEAAEASNG